MIKFRENKVKVHKFKRKVSSYTRGPLSIIHVRKC